MKSFVEWRLATADPAWERLKSEWGGGNKAVDANLVNKMKLKVEGIKEQYVRELGEKNIQSFRDVPPHMRDSLAQAIVVATVKAFYADTDTTAAHADQQTGQKPASGQTAPTQPQTELNAPSGWKG